MTLATPVPAGVSLEELLAAKERRAARQADWLTHYQQPVISLTLVTPGKSKTACATATPWGWRYRCATSCCGKTAGRCWTAWASGYPPDLKHCGASRIRRRKSKRTVQNWSDAPLGRLWIWNLICPENGLVGRQSLGSHLRRCLICDEPAHACSRSRHHPVEQVVSRVEKMIDDWFARD
ncbi:citrate lyase holo-[acyl-carrier protein] synthase [Enterobacter hormaechei]